LRPYQNGTCGTRLPYPGAVLVIRVSRTLQGVPEFSRGAPP